MRACAAAHVPSVDMIVPEGGQRGSWSHLHMNTSSILIMALLCYSRGHHCCLAASTWPNRFAFQRRFSSPVHNISSLIFPFFLTLTDCCFFFTISHPLVHLLFNKPTVSNLKSSPVCLWTSWCFSPVSEASLTGAHLQRLLWLTGSFDTSRGTKKMQYL